MWPSQPEASRSCPLEGRFQAVVQPSLDGRVPFLDELLEEFQVLGRLEPEGAGKDTKVCEDLGGGQAQGQVDGVCPTELEAALPRAGEPGKSGGAHNSADRLTDVADVEASETVAGGDCRPGSP